MSSFHAGMQPVFVNSHIAQLFCVSIGGFDDDCLKLTAVDRICKLHAASPFRNEKETVTAPPHNKHRSI